MKKIILALLVSLFLLRVGLCHEDDRKGFIFGGALGTALVSYTEKLDSVKTERQNRIALFTELKYGYAASRQLEIIYSHKQAWFGTDLPSTPGPFLEEFTILTLNTVSFTYYFKPRHPTFLVEGGIGYAFLWVPLEDNTSFGQSGAFGWGFQISTGYRLTENISLIGGLMYTLPKDKEWGQTYTFDGLIPNININFTAF